MQESPFSLEVTATPQYVPPPPSVIQFAQTAGSTNEPLTGSIGRTITVFIDEAQSQDIVIPFSVEGTGNNPATVGPGGDVEISESFNPVISSHPQATHTVTIPANMGTGTISLIINSDDPENEENETFSITLYSPTNTSILLGPDFVHSHVIYDANTPADSGDKPVYANTGPRAITPDHPIGYPDSYFEDLNNFTPHVTQINTQYDGQVIDGVKCHEISVRHSNVTIKRSKFSKIYHNAGFTNRNLLVEDCWIDAGGQAYNVSNNESSEDLGAGMVFRYCLFTGSVSTAILCWGGNRTNPHRVHHCDMGNIGQDVAKIANHFEMDHNWIHRYGTKNGPIHSDVVQNKGGTALWIHHNHINLAVPQHPGTSHPDVDPWADPVNFPFWKSTLPSWDPQNPTSIQSFTSTGPFPVGSITGGNTGLGHPHNGYCKNKANGITQINAGKVQTNDDTGVQYVAGSIIQPTQDPSLTVNNPELLGSNVNGGFSFVFDNNWVTGSGYTFRFYNGVYGINRLSIRNNIWGDLWLFGPWFIGTTNNVTINGVVAPNSVPVGTPPDLIISGNKWCDITDTDMYAQDWFPDFSTNGGKMEYRDTIMGGLSRLRGNAPVQTFGGDCYFNNA